MEEIQLQPFTFCSADDAQAETATSASTGANGCAGAPEGFGPEGGETRYAAATPFNHVNDYGGAASGAAGFTMNGINGLDNAAIAGLANYNASVVISEEAIGTVPQADSLRIDVRVWSGAEVDVTLTGYRTRYAPNATY
jgi:MSHA pilin protein MshD